MTDRIRMMFYGVKPPLFGGLMVANAPLYYDGNTFIIKDNDWNHSSYNSVYGKNAGSYYFNFVQVGQFFDSRGDSFSSYSGSIDNNGNKIIHNGHNDWRMPTRNDWNTIFFNRAGSTVNGAYGCKYAYIKLSGITHAGYSTPNVILFAPDDETLSNMPRTFTWNNNSFYLSNNSGVTSSQLKEFLDAGCALIPCSGHRTTSQWNEGGTNGSYWSATEYDSSHGSSCIFGSTYLNTNRNDSKEYYHFPIRLVRQYGNYHVDIPTGGTLVYTLSNHTCNGTSSTRINTNLKLFNATDYPNGFRIEFSGEATVAASSLSNSFGGWFGCMSEAGSPYPGFVIRQEKNTGGNSLTFGGNTDNGNGYNTSIDTCAPGASVSIVIGYDRTHLNMICNGGNFSVSGPINHNFTLCIGGTMSSTTDWFSDRYGNLKINSLKVYKL